ncbi:MAG: GGDEF domain-containing protein [Candidatus Thiodiazotropha lotti]|uniref:diguanylate cyclase n=1 Tax=Candidatus Thiodiazotropha endoloripes TaxID=1818881 RepID=A0A1E2UU78_9GAMM|nr:GGDEF domain-containing protein [Candidatus Thiodiazotropha endoloripes]MCG7900220.1 GGDEF domain-containing protein [Candidatus Thiodiazotropha weberae]MCG7993264.1 GGDEF domain-containing protein [Candidatus Thiodiazotropha lotti]MCG7903011.1 GGDEF domain-containing protein [Candidatus Thiodiazotropha weberae]MCG8001391.1 GGDEF domain-containing protein [Candidatus Thiodiazotropha lotti]MCW4184926.1 GGDEF domain-containing protein [Candidatus Thiodiazotropha weberae]
MNIKDTDFRRGYQLSMLVGASGSTFLIVFGIIAIVNDRQILGLTLLAITLLVLVSMFLMWLMKNPSFGINGISIAVVIAFTYIISTGGIDNTGPLWCYPLTLIMMLLQGLRRGVIALFVLLIIAIVVMYIPFVSFVTADYPQSFKVRFIASFFALSIMVTIYEFLRERTHKRYIEISNELEHASHTDMLTGLANRREMLARLDAAYGTYNRHGAPFSIIMADLDNFKRINDTYGHVVGDHLLIGLGKLLSSVVRRQDLVSRWGGEEFLIMLSQTDRRQAMEVAEKLRLSVESAVFSDENKYQITLSLGVQSITEAVNTDTMIRDADRFLYEAKRRGRNRVAGPL